MTSYPREMLKAGAAVICRCEGPHGIAMTHAEIVAAVLDATLGLSQAELDVIAERRRQIEVEGWTAESDDHHPNGSLEKAAACYAWAASLSERHRAEYAKQSNLKGDENDNRVWFNTDGLRLLWMWARRWWKPTTRRQDLVKSCALGLAALDRIDRKAAKEASPAPEPTP
ncbi:hypothetical protein [Pleomorphomonas koreensis]|uniref:hypothetical protein n=1 Tax=Pleomorphomonas koreensis TaxID=257440 RepID=UPI00041BD68B|nr:hypothetical protein [Pleomorphomonas koreensis]